jgi:MFS family permease
MSPIWAYEQVIPFQKYNVIVVLTNARYWNGHYPPLLRGAVNAASNIGNIIGQLSFGFLGDAFGRTHTNVENDMDLLLPSINGHWYRRRLSHVSLNCVRAIPSPYSGTIVSLDFLQPRMGNTFYLV